MTGMCKNGVCGVSIALRSCLLFAAFALPTAVLARSRMHGKEEDLLQVRDYANVVVVRPDVQVNASGEGIDEHKTIVLPSPI